MNFSQILGNISLRYYHAINIVRLALAFLGIWVFFTLPYEQYPNIPLYYVHILVPYPGADVALVEEEVTTKLESALQELEHIQRVNSFVSPGLNFTHIAYKQQVSKEEFQNAIHTLKNSVALIDFSPNIGKVFIDDFSYADFSSVVSVVLQLDDMQDSNSQDTLMKHAKELLYKLQNTEGILKVSTKGYYPKTVQVQIRQEDIKKYGGISSSEIRNILKKQMLVIPAGLLKDTDRETSTSTTSSGKDIPFSFHLKTDTWIKNIQDIENIVIRQNPVLVRIKDIATVQFAFDDSSELVRYNGKVATVFKIHKQTNADSLQLVDTIKKQLSHYQSTIGQDISVSYFADTTTYISNTIHTLSSNAFIGLILVFFVMLIFLGIKSALIIGMQIPLTFTSSFLVLKMMGITLNGATLFALVLVLGMVVDHSIIVLESILYNRYQKHINKKEAIISGLGEMVGPVLTAYFTTIAAFIPLAFMPGIIGDFLYPVPVTIVVVLSFSVLIAIFVIPPQYMNLIGSDIKKEFALTLWGQKVIKKILDILIKHRILSGLGFVFIIGASISVFFFTPISLYDTEEDKVFLVDVIMPHGSTLQNTKGTLNIIETKLLRLQSEGLITGIVSIIGNIDPDYVEGIKAQSTNDIQFQVQVAGTVNEVSDNLSTVIFRVQELLSTVQGVKSVRVRKQRVGPPLPDSLEFKLVSLDNDELENSYNVVMEKLSSYDTVQNIRSSRNEKNKEYIVKVDKEALQKFGISIAQIGTELRYFFANEPVSTLISDNKSYDVYFGFFGDNKLSKESIKDIQFINSSNTVVPFSDIAVLEEFFGDSYIERENGRRIVRIRANVTRQQDIKTIEHEIIDHFNQYILDTDAVVELKSEGEFEEFSSLLNDIILLFCIGIVIIYVVLTVDFKSYLQPFLIIMTIFSTAVGISMYLLISQTALSIIILYSFLAIMGITVDGSIVLINISNRLVEKGTNYLEAIKVASVRRFKPIILTNITTIAGVLPTALGIAGNSPIWRPMSITIVIGLSTCMFITLFFIPVFYALLPHKK